MEKFTIVDFEELHLDAAGAFLASRHRAERRRFPLLPERYEDAAETRELVRAAMGYAEGVAAVDGDGALAGFLFTYRNLVDPSSPRARYAAARESMLLAHAHAVAPDAEPSAIYHALFAVLAERLLTDGIFEHVAHVPAGNSTVLDAWYSLGFGKANAVAIRDLSPLRRSGTRAVEIRRATPDDIDIVQRLVDEEARFHATSPIFRPYVAEQTQRAVRASLMESLERDTDVHLIARAEGEDAGIIDVGPGRGSPLYVPPGAAYIGDTAVRPEFRGTGVGTALVEAGLAWARERGFRAMTLHFATTNALSSSFWTGLGFEVAMWHLRRRIDEQIASHRP